MEAHYSEPLIKLRPVRGCRGARVKTAEGLDASCWPQRSWPPFLAADPSPASSTSVVSREAERALPIARVMALCRTVEESTGCRGKVGIS